MITYLAGGAEIYRLYTPPPCLQSSYLALLHVTSASAKEVFITAKQLRAGPQRTSSRIPSGKKLARTLADALFTFILAAARSDPLVIEGHDLSGSSKRL